MCHHLVAVAYLGHTGADGCDRPGCLRPERHRSRAADLPATDPDELVPVADPGGNDVDEDLACRRRRKLVHLEDLDGLAECCDPGRSHPVRRTLLASVMRRGTLWHLARGVRRDRWQMTCWAQCSGMTPELVSLLPVHGAGSGPWAFDSWSCA